MILCGYTGGYTELGGGEAFLKKIRKDLKYKRLTPAIWKRGPRFDRIREAVIRDKDSGITGPRLLRRILERLRRSEFKESAAALIVFDDTDCKLQDEQQKYHQAKTNFIKNVKEINPNLPIIFFLADPEIEMWFYHDKQGIFKDEVPLIKSLNELYGEYKVSGWQYDKDKDACTKKFSELFADMLLRQRIIYSKREDGSDYLRKISPYVVAKNDSDIRRAVEELAKMRSEGMNRAR